MGMIIAGDGYAYVVYSYLDNGWWDYDGGQPEHVHGGAGEHQRSL